MFSRGAIGFSTHRDKRLSKLIRWFTGHQYSHTFLVADIVGLRKTNKHRVYILDAFQREASYNSITMYLGTETAFEVWEPIDITIDEIDQALGATEKKFLKKPYSLAPLLGIAIKQIVRGRLGWVINNPLSLGVYCGEMVYHYLDAIMPISLQTSGIPSDAVAPGDLLHFVKTSGRFRQIHVKGFDE